MACPRTPAQQVHREHTGEQVGSSSHAGGDLRGEQRHRPHVRGVGSATKPSGLPRSSSVNCSRARRWSGRSTISPLVGAIRHASSTSPLRVVAVQRIEHAEGRAAADRPGPSRVPRPSSRSGFTCTGCWRGWRGGAATRGSGSRPAVAEVPTGATRRSSDGRHHAGRTSPRWVIAFGCPRGRRFPPATRRSAPTPCFAVSPRSRRIPTRRRSAPP